MANNDPEVVTNMLGMDSLIDNAREKKSKMFSCELAASLTGTFVDIKRQKINNVNLTCAKAHMNTWEFSIYCLLS